MAITPTLTRISYAQARMMDRGTFTLFHAWGIGEGFSVEYWRGIDNNGACLRTLHDGQMVSITHYATPGAAIRVLRMGDYPVPGLPAMTAEEKDEAARANTRQLRAGLVAHTHA